MTITVGNACEDRTGATVPGDQTYIDKNTTADGTGSIDYICLYINAAATGVEVASFVNENLHVFSTNGTATLGDMGVGLQEFNAPGDFTAFPINEGEYIGFHHASGKVDATGTGGSGIWYKAGDSIPCESVTFDSYPGWILSIYATGTETGGPTVVQVNCLFIGSSMKDESLSRGCKLTPDILNVGSIPQSLTFKGGVTVMPSVLNIASVVQSTGIKCGITISPSLLSIAAMLQDETFKGAVTIAPAVLSVDTQAKSPTIVIAGAVVIKPGCLIITPQIISPQVLTKEEMRVLSGILKEILSSILGS